ncbi:hypothetical protein FN846DRAFT_910437 [Sphaerosporella brunnea]|uniref:Chromo domain-containing protein n=1 Tax=Sphaerosporella brunnea TaxID=1250544 RepID=A0A5J5EN54_9PEZI|nr:hypothetical protein FN846DRAFT_910437 [Sphaerosporella brunnea]
MLSKSFYSLIGAHSMLIGSSTQQIYHPPAPALGVEGGNHRAEYGVEEIRSWRRNPEEGGRLEYEVEWEDDGELWWEPEESFGKGGKEILNEFKERDAQLQHELAAETGKTTTPQATKKASLGDGGWRITRFSRQTIARIEKGRFRFFIAEVIALRLLRPAEAQTLRRAGAISTAPKHRRLNDGDSLGDSLERWRAEWRRSPNGMNQVLRERGLWREAAILSAQPDFKGQRSRI